MLDEEKAFEVDGTCSLEVELFVNCNSPRNKRRKNNSISLYKVEGRFLNLEI